MKIPQDFVAFHDRFSHLTTRSQLTHSKNCSLGQQLSFFGQQNMWTNTQQTQKTKKGERREKGKTADKLCQDKAGKIKNKK